MACPGAALCRAAGLQASLRDHASRSRTRSFAISARHTPTFPERRAWVALTFVSEFYFVDFVSSSHPRVPMAIRVRFLLIAASTQGVAAFAVPAACAAAHGSLRCDPPVSVARLPSRAHLAQVVRTIWSRCTDEVCTIAPGPVRWLQSGMALAARPFKRRPLLKLAKNECSIGVFKVARIDGNRQWLLLPLKAKDECSVRGGALPTPRAIAHV